MFTLPLPPHLLEFPAWVEGSIAPAQGPSEGPLLASEVLLSPGTSAKGLVPEAQGSWPRRPRGASFRKT